MNSLRKGKVLSLSMSPVGHTQWLLNGQISCLLFCWAWTQWHGFCQPSSPSPRFPSCCAHPRSFLPVREESSIFSNRLSSYYSQSHRSVHQALGAQWLSHIVLFKNLKNVDLKRKIIGYDTQRSSGSKISVKQTDLKPNILSSPLSVKFSNDYWEIIAKYKLNE